MKTSFFGILFCLCMPLIVYSQNELSTLALKTATENKDTIYTKVQFSQEIYGFVNKHYTPCKYKRILYVLKIEDLRLQSYEKEVRKEITKVFKEFKIPAVSLDEVKAQYGKSGSGITELLDKEFDALVILTFTSDATASHDIYTGLNTKSLSIHLVTHFFDKTFTKVPCIKVDALVNSHYFKVNSLTAKAVRGTFYYGLIKHNLFIQ